METLYLDDPTGLKPSKLSLMEVKNSKELAQNAMVFMSQNLIKADAKKAFFTQNITTHLIYLFTLIKKTSPSIKKIYISDHEIRWIKEMLEVPGYQPDATHSNYRNIDPIESIVFPLEIVKFEDFEKIAQKNLAPAIFYISHVSRLTGEIAPVESIFKAVKTNNPDSIVIVDGAQTLGAFAPLNINEVSDAYLAASSKFLGAEPHLGMAFISDSFYEKYIGNSKNYPAFNAKLYSRDLYSLWQNLKNPLYLSDYNSYIKSLKNYAINHLKEIDETIIYNPHHQAPNFLTLNFGSVEKNQNFVLYAKENHIILSENSNIKWSLIKPPVPLVRIGLSIRITENDIDRLVEVIKKALRV